MNKETNKLKEIGLRLSQVPGKPAQLVVLTIGVIVSLSTENKSSGYFRLQPRMSNLISHADHWDSSEKF